MSKKHGVRGILWADLIYVVHYLSEFVSFSCLCYYVLADFFEYQHIVIPSSYLAITCYGAMVVDLASGICTHCLSNCLEDTSC